MFVLRGTERAPLCCFCCHDSQLDPQIAERDLTTGLETFSVFAGVEKINCDWTEQKVVVTGPVPQEEVLAACRKMFKHSEPWK